MFLVNQEEVIEIAPYFLGWLQDGKDFQFLFFRKGRKALGQETHLDRVGNFQFTLNAFLGGGGFGKIADILLKGDLHILEGVGKGGHFVAGADRGNLHFQIAPRYFTRLVGKDAKGFGDGPGNGDDDNQQGKKPGGADCQNDGAQLADTGKELVFRKDHADRPPQRWQWGIIHPGLLAGKVIFQNYKPFATMDHIPADLS